MSNSRFGLRTRAGQIKGIVEVNPFDIDAFLFLSAAQITNESIRNAVNKLVIALKTYGLWTKMKAIYPFVGGTSTTHKFNLKNPQDLDSAFRLIFNGGWTHSSNGGLPNGTNAYANTYLNPVANSLTPASAHLSYYARTVATTSDPAEIGNYTNNSIGFVLQSRSIAGTNRYFYSLPNSASQVVSAAPVGLIMGSSIANTRRDLYLNGVSVANNTTTDTGTLGNYNLFLGAGNINNTSIASYTNAQCAFASIGEGLTSQEALNLYNSVQNFNTALNRQV